MLLSGKSGQEIWGFEISRFPGSSCRDFGKCLYIGKHFSDTDIYHSDIKNTLVLRYCKLIFSCLLKIIFQNSQNFSCEIKSFLQFVEKMKKLKLSLSKQHNKMLKIKSEMLKIRNVKIIKLENFFRENFPGIC